MRKALANLPWVDQDKIEVNAPKQAVKITVTNMAKFNEKQLLGAFEEASMPAKVVAVSPKGEKKGKPGK